VSRAESRTFCSELSSANGEPLGATASRLDHWLLVEYRGLWARDELRESLLPGPVKAHLRAQLAALPRSRLLFVRRAERRREVRHAVFYGRTDETAPRFHRLEVAGYEELLELDFAAALTDPAATPPGEPLEDPLLVVCTHGKRDPCCAKYGRPLYEALREHADEGWVWQSTHVGGDRFAGNLLCLPEGLYYGRVGRLDALPVLVEHLAGRVDLRRYRGRCCYSFAAQAAELEVRVRTGATGIHDVRLDAEQRLPDGGYRIRVRTPEGAYEVEVVRELGKLTQLTCSAASPKRPRRFAPRSVRTLPGPAA
jgi:hypothetical protein